MQMGRLSQVWLGYVWKDMKMCQTRLVNFRLSKNQYEMLINRMESMGYRSISQFIRDCVLQDDLATIRLLKDIHEKIVGGEKNDKNSLYR